MAYKIITPLTPSQPAQSPQQSSLFRPLASGLIKSLRGLEGTLHGIASGASSLLSGEFPVLSSPETEIRGPLSSGLQYLSGLTEEQLQPQSTPERVLHRFLEHVPYGAALGGIPGVVASGLGSVAGGTAEGIFGEKSIIPDVVQLGSEIGIGSIPRIPGISKKFPNLQKFIKPNLSITAEKTAADDALRKAVSATTRTDISLLNKEANRINDLLGLEAREGTRGKISSILQTIERNIEGNKINPVKLADLRASLYEAGAELATKDRIKYIDPLTRSINSSLADYKKINPVFGKALEKRDQLGHVARSLSSSNLTDLVTGLLPEKSSKAAVKLFTPIDSVLRHVEGFVKSNLNPQAQPAALKFYGQALRGVVKNDPHLFVKNFKKFKQSVGPNWDALLQSPSQRKGGYKIIYPPKDHSAASSQQNTTG